MKLSEWAREKNISYKTAYDWFKKGKMPCRTEQTLTGTILVYDDYINSININDEILLKKIIKLFVELYGKDALLRLL